MIHRYAIKLITLVAVLLAVILLLSATPAQTAKSKRPNSAEQAKGIFLKSAKNLKAARSVTAKLIGTRTNSQEDVSVADFQLQKPQSFRFVQSGIELYSDGKTMSNYLVDEQKYFTRKASDNPKDLPGVYGMAAFFNYSILDSLPYLIKSTGFHMAGFQGVASAAMTIHFESFERDDNMTVYVDAQTALPLGWDQNFGGTKMTFSYSGLKLNSTIDPKVFAWTPPAGVAKKF